MIKKKNSKKRFDLMKKNGVYIRCSYCSLNATCKTRQYKEESENYGFDTYCTLTPHKTKRFFKTKKKRERRRGTYE